MNRDEKTTWAWSLPLMGAISLLGLGGCLGSHWGERIWLGIFFIFAPVFMLMFTVWLFRVTYEAGRSRR